MEGCRETVPTSVTSRNPFTTFRYVTTDETRRTPKTRSRDDMLRIRVASPEKSVILAIGG